jgi:RecG-like helicase
VKILKGALARLSRPPEEVRAEHLRHWAATIDGACPIAEVVPRRRCKVAGVIQNLRIDPRQGRNAVEATISDGTGELVARFLGRNSLQGIKLGAGLIVEGVPSRSPDGECLILNPEYQLIPDPEHG